MNKDQLIDMSIEVLIKKFCIYINFLSHFVGAIYTIIKIYEVIKLCLIRLNHLKIKPR